MSDKKITELPDGGAVQSTDEFVAARAGTNVKIAGSEMGGGGGSGSVLTATLTLDNDGIIALSTTPAVVVPATTIVNYDPAITPDVIYRPIAATAIFRNLATYTGGGGDSPVLLLAYSSDWANDASSRCSLPLSSIGTFQLDLPCPPSDVPDPPGLQVLGVGGQPINGDWLDNALSFAYSGPALSGGGDPGNSLSLTVLYMALATT